MTSTYYVSYHSGCYDSVPMKSQHYGQMSDGESDDDLSWRWVEDGHLSECHVRGLVFGQCELGGWHHPQHILMTKPILSHANLSLDGTKTPLGYHH